MEEHQGAVRIVPLEEAWFVVHEYVIVRLRASRRGHLWACPSSAT